MSRYTSSQREPDLPSTRLKCNCGADLCIIEQRKISSLKVSWVYMWHYVFFHKMSKEMVYMTLSNGMEMESISTILMNNNERKTVSRCIIVILFIRNEQCKTLFRTARLVMNI